MTIQPSTDTFTTPAFVLSSKAMLANLSITQWTARKLDKRVTAATNSAHGAAHDAGNYNKALIAGEALAKIVTAANAARGIHYERTLPWLDNGARMLSAAAYFDYSKAMRECREAFESAVAEFVANYPQYCEDARKRLGDMYNPADYPGADQIAAKFTFGVSLYQVPVADDFRVQISEGEAQAIRAEIEARSQKALEAATKDVWERIAENVGHMATKLAEFKPGTEGVKASGVFRDSLVENVRSLARILPSLNLTGDSRLSDMTARVERELCRFDAEELRSNDACRSKVQEAAAEIVAAVSEFI